MKYFVEENLKVTGAEFTSALKLLDDKLFVLQTMIEIKSIGGYALMMYGIRDVGTTKDIDTVTKTYSKEVETAILEVAEELSLPKDWLNNDPVFDNKPDITIEVLELHFYELRTNLKMIKLYLPNLDGLLKSKILALQDTLDRIDAGQDYFLREHDFYDIKSILKYKDITSYDQYLEVIDLFDPHTTPNLDLVNEKIKTFLDGGVSLEEIKELLSSLNDYLVTKNLFRSIDILTLEYNLLTFVGGTLEKEEKTLLHLRDINKVLLISPLIVEGDEWYKRSSFLIYTKLGEFSNLTIRRLDKESFYKYCEQKDLIEREVELFLTERLTKTFNKDLEESSVFKKGVRKNGK